MMAFVTTAARHKFARLGFAATGENIKAGCGLMQLAASLPDDMQHWLAAQIPEGATLSDAVRAIITDAYFEDTEQ